jgi:hypothetical protein
LAEDGSKIKTDLKVSPTNIYNHIAQFSTCTPTVDDNSCTVAYASTIESTYSIEPDEGEEYGDCVKVTYKYEGNATVTYSGNAAATAGIGGPSVSAEAIDDPLNANVELFLPARIVINPSTEPSTQFAFDAVVISSNGTSINPVRSGKFIARNRIFG